MNSNGQTTSIIKAGFLMILAVCFACSPKTYHSGFSSTSPGSSYNSNDIPPKPEAGPGECWQLVEMPRNYEQERQVYYEFTGKTIPQVGVIETKVIVKPKVESWVKKQATENCYSSDPKDCLVWCLVTEEADVETFNEVRDTSAIKDFKEKVIYVNQLTDEPHKDWIRVICQGEITESFVSEARKNLIARSYKVPIDCTTISCLLPSLKEFQIDKKLHVGSLNYETFESLGGIVK